MTFFVVDTNVISDILLPHSIVIHRMQEAVETGNRLFLPQPAKYETIRGLLHKNATRRDASKSFMKRSFPYLRSKMLRLKTGI